MTWRNEVAKDAEAVLREFPNGVPPTVYYQVALEIADCIPSPDGERNGLTEKMAIAELRRALRAVVADIHEYERVNNLAPNPGRKECWDSVARAVEILRADA